MHTEIVQTLKSGKSKQDLPRIVEALRDYDPFELFETLFQLSTREQGRGEPVAFGAYALNELNPTCPLNLEAAVESLLPHWDTSIEEVVFYLAKQFGAQAVESAALELRKKYNIGTPATCLEAISYWANIYSAKSQ